MNLRVRGPILAQIDFLLIKNEDLSKQKAGTLMPAVSSRGS